MILCCFNFTSFFGFPFRGVLRFGECIQIHVHWWRHLPMNGVVHRCILLMHARLNSHAIKSKARRKATMLEYTNSAGAWIDSTMHTHPGSVELLREWTTPSAIIHFVHSSRTIRSLLIIHELSSDRRHFPDCGALVVIETAFSPTSEIASVS